MSDSPLVLSGRYEIREVLGRGGMAEVHRALDVRLGRVVAVKMLRADLARDPEFQDRFTREAQSAASLNHPTIVAVYDTGEDWVNGDRVPFIVMELVEGTTLRDLLQTGRRLLPERALEITAGILTALDYSHRHGIVHRDIKPGNVMLTPRGDVKVMDFGIARTIAEATAAVTQGSAVVGTAQYLSPEQARGEQVDARTDLYSTGCVLFELLTGRPPFIGESPVSVAYQHVREPAPAPSTIDPTLSRTLDVVVLKSLAKDRYERYQTAAEMRADLERARTGGTVLARMPDTTASTQMLTPVPTVERTVVRPTPVVEVVSRRDVPPPPRRHTGAYLLLALAVIAMFAGGIVIAQRYFVNQSVYVPDVRNASVAVATAKITAKDLVVNPQAQNVGDDSIAEGLVIRTEPTGKVKKQSVVTLIVSSGPKRVPVPSLVQKSLQDARDELATQELVDKLVEKNDPADKNTVLAQDPAPSTPVLPGSAVTLTVSTGLVDLPADLVGKPLEEVQQILASSAGHFRTSTKGIPTQDQAQDRIVQQVITPSPQKPGATIILYYGKYNEPASSTPPVTPSEQPVDPGASGAPSPPG